MQHVSYLLAHGSCLKCLMLQAYALSLMPHCLLSHDSCILPLASCKMSHASCLIVSCLISHVSYFMPHGSWAWLMPYASCLMWLMPHASLHASCLISRIMPHASLSYDSCLAPNASYHMPKALCLMPCHLPQPKDPTPHDIAVTRNKELCPVSDVFSLKPSQNFSHYIENWWPVLLAPKDHPLVRSKQMKMELQSFLQNPSFSRCSGCNFFLMCIKTFLKSIKPC